MKAKLYLITDKQDNLLGVIKHTSYAKAFAAFRKKVRSPEVIHGLILTPEELHQTMLDGMKVGEIVAAP